MDVLAFTQWCAMLFTLVAAWMVASKDGPHRTTGFWLFLISNVLWAAWGWHTSAYAVIVLQLALAPINLRGAIKAEQKM